MYTDNRAGLLVTVAVCSRSRSLLMEKAVLSVAIQAQELETIVEVLIIDNASTDQTPSVAARLSSEYSCVHAIREENLGLSNARNTALRRARGKFVIFLDDDATALDGWLNAYVDFLSNLPNDRVAVVGGPVSPVYEKPPRPWYGSKKNRLDLGSDLRRIPAYGGPWGCNIGYHRQRALKAGGFDSTLGRSGSGLSAHEESELNQRLEDRGFEIWWVPAARIEHFFPVSRLTLHCDLRGKFAEGESAVFGRFRRYASPTFRIAYGLLRLVLLPVHCLVNLFIALITLPIKDQQVTVSNLRQVARSLGFGLGILRIFPLLIAPQASFAPTGLTPKPEPAQSTAHS